MMALRVLQKQKHADHTNIQSKAKKQETQTIRTVNNFLPQAATIIFYVEFCSRTSVF